MTRIDQLKCNNRSNLNHVKNSKWSLYSFLMKILLINKLAIWLIKSNQKSSDNKFWKIILWFWQVHRTSQELLCISFLSKTNEKRFDKSQQTPIFNHFDLVLYNILLFILKLSSFFHVLIVSLGESISFQLPTTFFHNITWVCLLNFFH